MPGRINKSRPHVIIDGYNVIHAIPPMKKTLAHHAETSRELLIHAVARFAIKNNLRCTIVFDGAAAGESALKKMHAPVHVLFSFPISADEKIRHLIEQSKHRQSMSIITSDREILRFAMTHSCQTHSSRHFANLLSEIDDDASEKSEESLTDAQVQEWLKIFGER